LILQPIRKLSVFLMPAVLLVVVWLLVPQAATLGPAHRELFAVSPYLAAALGMFLAVHFHRGRPFLALLLLVLFYWCSVRFLRPGPVQSGFFGLYQTFIFLLPINFLLFSLMREKGVFSFAGRLRALFLLLQGGTAYWLLADSRHDASPCINHMYGLLPFLDTCLFPNAALLLAVFSLAIMLLIALRRGTPVESGLLWALLAYYIACNWFVNNTIHTAYCAAAALVITLSLLHDSYNMAFRDDLTGIPSRRAMNEAMNGLGRQYVIAMVDVDHFKRFNDTYGHDVGDQVLKLVACKVREVGGGGRGYRYGGEEFAILFPGGRLDDVMPHLEELRAAIAGYSMALRGSGRPRKEEAGRERRGSNPDAEYVSVTVSIGAAERNAEYDSRQQVLQAADRALYKSKSWGRNMVSRA